MKKEERERKGTEKWERGKRNTRTSPPKRGLRNTIAHPGYEHPQVLAWYPGSFSCTPGREMAQYEATWDWAKQCVLISKVSSFQGEDNEISVRDEGQHGYRGVLLFQSNDIRKMFMWCDANHPLDNIWLRP